MMRPGCLRAGALLARRAAGVTEAERLLLEGHLARCGRCREESALLAAARELAESPRPPLTPHARERAIARALAVGAAGRDAGRAALAPGGSAWSRPGIPLALFGAAALGIAVVAGLRWRGAGEAPLATSTSTSAATATALPSPRPPGALIEGEAEADGVALRPGERIGEGPASFRAKGKGARLALGHAEVALEAGSELAWDPSTSLASLRSGAVEVEVDPAPGAPFRVATPRFVVEVVGTRFRVDLAGVRVREGIVKVAQPDGRPIVEALRAGEEWLAPAEPDGQGSPDAGTPDPERSVESPPHASATPAERLKSARQRLAKGDTKGARRELDAILAGGTGAREEAEARTLLAECALVEGDSAGAARRYEDVARRYPGQAAGENALFAAARLDANAGRKEKARALLREYLRRYPKGRFRKEAATRLEALGG